MLNVKTLTVGTSKTGEGRKYESGTRAKMGEKKCGGGINPRTKSMLGFQRSTFKRSTFNDSKKLRQWSP
jgi:hypothetical protein